MENPIAERLSRIHRPHRFWYILSLQVIVTIIHTLILFDSSRLIPLYIFFLEYKVEVRSNVMDNADGVIFDKEKAFGIGITRIIRAFGDERLPQTCI